MSTKRYCRCCGYQTLSGEGPSGDICPVCAWIDEASDQEDSANPPLLAAQECMASFGAVDECYASIIRKPNADEPRNPNWQLEREVFGKQRAALLSHIEFAFRDVFRHDGLNLDEAEDLDGYQPPAVDRKADGTTPWRDISDETLCHFQAMPFLDAKGMKYYLPAFMHWIVRESENNNSLTSDQLVWSIRGSSKSNPGKFALLVEEQRECVIEFLRFLHRFEHLGFSDDAHAALSNWRE